MAEPIKHHLSFKKKFKRWCHIFIPEDIFDFRRFFFVWPKVAITYFSKKKEYLKDTRRDLPPGAFQNYLSIVTFIYNEAGNITEWIEYHLLVGVEKFYIYDHGSTDNIKEVLEPYIKSNIVEYIILPGRIFQYQHLKQSRKRQKEETKFSLTIQIPAYQDAIRRAKYSTFWMAFIDIDEFIVPVEQAAIPEFLRDYEDYAGVEINWLIYGSSGLEKKDKRLVIEKFQFHSLSSYKANNQGKLIANPRHIFVKWVHDGWFFAGKKAVNSDKCIKGREGYTITHNKIRLNHYYSKSLEEWLIKRKNVSLEEAAPDIIEEFNKKQADCNTVTDDPIMLKYIEPLKAALQCRVARRN